MERMITSIECKLIQEHISSEKTEDPHNPEKYEESDPLSTSESQVKELNYKDTKQLNEKKSKNFKMIKNERDKKVLNKKEEFLNLTKFIKHALEYEDALIQLESEMREVSINNQLEIRANMLMNANDNIHKTKLELKSMKRILKQKKKKQNEGSGMLFELCKPNHNNESGIDQSQEQHDSNSCEVF